MSLRSFWLPRSPHRDEFAVSIAVGVSAMILAALASGSTDRLAGPKEKTQTVAAASTEVVSLTPEELAADARLRQHVLGRWKMHDHGERIIENRPDGTASMDLTFDFVASLLYGAKMSLELTWTVEKEILAYEIVSGKPKKASDSMMKTYGRKAAYRIAEIQSHEMELVRISDPDEKYTWIRLDDLSK